MKNLSFISVRENALPLLLSSLFALTVVAANWTLNRYGFVSIGFGLIAPAGVYWAGLAFGLRDAVHEVGGRSFVLASIAVGGVLSYFIDPAFAIASATAFILSEVADLAIYEPLRKKKWWLAVALSNIVGSVVDSLLFLYIAFNSVGGWYDLTVGKAYMIIPAIVLVGAIRHALPRHS
jgi:queuosine precursor transporter